MQTSRRTIYLWSCFFIFICAAARMYTYCVVFAYYCLSGVEPFQFCFAFLYFCQVASIAYYHAHCQGLLFKVGQRCFDYHAFVYGTATFCYGDQGASMATESPGAISWPWQTATSHITAVSAVSFANRSPWDIQVKGHARIFFFLLFLPYRNVILPRFRTCAMSVNKSSGIICTF